MTEGEEKTAQIQTKGDSSHSGTVPQDKTQTIAQTQGARLVCLEGPLKGKEIPLSEGPFIIGRRDGLQLTLADGRVSRRHAEIAYEDGEYIIRDLGSRMGTKVNGRRVREKNLRHGDRIKIGKTEFRLIGGLEGVSTGVDIRRIVERLRERPLIPCLLYTSDAAAE